MAVYTVGFKNEKYVKLDVAKLGTVVGAVIVDASVADENLAEAYCALKRNLTTPSVKTILVGASKDTDGFKVLSTLMAAYGRYDVYVTDQEQLGSSEYIEELVKREAGPEEAEVYLDSSLSAYNELVKLLLRLREAVASDSQDEVSTLISENQGSIIEAATLVDSLKHWADLWNSGEAERRNKAEEAHKSTEAWTAELQGRLDEALAEAKGLRDSLEETKGQLVEASKRADEASKMAEDASKRAEDASKRAEEAEKKAGAVQAGGISQGDLAKAVSDAQEAVRAEYQAKVTAVEKQLKDSQNLVQAMQSSASSGAPVIVGYRSLQTSTFRCTVGSVLYFKEISDVPYAGSMIQHLIKFMSDLQKLNVKLLIYDNKHGFLGTYGKVPVIDYLGYRGQQEIYRSKAPELVIVEPNIAIIEDIMKSEYDVVVVLDRMKQIEDVVTGNNVHKFWMMNSKADFHALSAKMDISESDVVTRPGVLDGAIEIAEIADYRAMTPGARMMQYKSLPVRAGSNDKLLDVIRKRGSVDKLIKKARR